MSSGSKFARGTGRGQFGPSQNRGRAPSRHGPGSGKKTAAGQGRDTAGTLGAGNGGTATNAREESFQLLAEPNTTGCPFAMFIRLQPEILEELKQAEADGIQASMKFGTNASGHVIQVGSESFKFSSASEPGDLCDIYEQKQGEFGEAFLVEAGSAWRKLSVQRILSATEKDRVKKRTAEAEHRQKQRKSILVDPSTQMIIPQAGAADANGRKPVPKLSKEPPPKKRRVTASPIKQRQTTASAVTGHRQFASPASPSIDPLGTSVKITQTIPLNDSNPPKGRAGSERVTGPSSSAAKEKPRSSAPPAVPESAKSGSATNLTDLRNFLIGFMQENPKGVTNKAIEKAVAENLFGVADKRALDKVMKSIASFHAPGKYLLNPGVEKGNYLEPGPPTVSGRVQEAVMSNIHEVELFDGSVVKEGMKEKDDPSSFDRVSTIVKEVSPKYTGAQPLKININNEDLSKQETVHGSRDPTTGVTDTSSSSGSGSGSDSESNSSGSGTGSESGSGSRSGSDSDSSSSSSGASVDEDVDIMSDDDAEKGKPEAKQRPKLRDPKPPAKEDSKSYEANKCKEADLNLNLRNPLATLDATNDVGSDTPAKVSDKIIEAVFGSDEMDDFEEHISNRPEIKSGQSKYGERKAPAKTQMSKGSKDINLGECHQIFPTRDNEALGITENSDFVVEKVSKTNKEVRSGGGSRDGLLVSQQDHSKPRTKSQGTCKDNDKRSADAEYTSGSNLERRDRAIPAPIDGRPALKDQSSLEGHNLPPEGSPTDIQELPTKTSSEKSSQAGAEVRKTVSKKVNSREVHEKFDKSKALEALVKEKSPGDVARGTQGSANAFELSLKLDDERIDRVCDRGSAGTSDFPKARPKKDKTMDERTSTGAKIGDISSRQSRDFETQHLHQKDFVAPSKSNVHRVSREWNYPGGLHDRDSPHTHKSIKVVKHSREKVDVLERAGFSVEQAERPLEDSDSARRTKEVYGKFIMKEAESGGRLQGGEHFNVGAREAARFGESAQIHGRSNVQENCKSMSQLPELRDPRTENGALEPKKRLPSVENSRGKAPSGTANRLPYKGSSSPDQDDFQPLDRRLLDMSRQSPVRVFEDTRHYAPEARNTKRPEETESMEMERSKRRTGVGQVKQTQHKDEWFQGGLLKQNHTEKGRFSASESQEYACTGKFSAFENSVRSEEETDGLYRHQRPTRAASIDLRKDNLKAGDALDNSNRQSPESGEELEGYEFFAPYEKRKPDLRGLINTFQEYKEYYKEYHEKYAIYVRLNGVIERHKKPFESLRKDMDRARSKEDEKKLAHTCAKVRREYARHRKKRKRMFQTFRVLHEELKSIKTRCKEYAEKVGQG